MENSHYILKSLDLESYIAHDPLPRVDMGNLVYNSITDAKRKEDQAKHSDVICDRQGVSDDVSQITADIQADDFFSSLELQSSSKLSSNMLGLSFSNKLASGIVTRSRFSSAAVQDASKAPGKKTAAALKTKGRSKRGGGRRSEKGGSVAGRRAKSKGKKRKLRSGKKLSADGKDKVSMLADSKKQNSNKLEEHVLEKSLSVEKCKDDDDWVLFNNLGLKKESDEKEPSDLQHSVRRFTPELFSMSPILMEDGMSESKDEVDNFLEAEDYDDSFLEDMEEFNYAPLRSHTGGKWKPETFRISPMLWHSQNWDSFSEDRHQEEERKNRLETLADSSIEALGEKSNKLSSTPSTGSKWRSLAPPATHTGGKWKPSEFPLSTSNQPKSKKFDLELASPKDSWKYDSEREAGPPPSHTGGKWTPSSSHATELWKPDSGDLQMASALRGKWGSPSAKRSTLDALAHSQSSSGKCLKTSGGMIHYYCTPCNRRLSSKQVYRKHVLSELHLRRVLQENELEFNTRSLKLFQELLSIGGRRERGLGKRLIKRPEIFGNSEAMKIIRKNKNGTAVMKFKRKRVMKKEIFYCEVCRTKVPSHLIGKHFVSYYHSRRLQLSDPEQQKLILDNIHAIVKQAPYQCGICKFYCNTHALFKEHWALAVHKEVEVSKNRRFWCAFCSFETETSRSMELHLDSNSHREVILAVNKSIPIIIRHKLIFNCGICSKEFRFNRELNRHREIFHEKADSDKKNKFACPVCQLTWKSRKSLQMHTLIAHKGDKVQYFCSFCDEFFSTAAEVKIHRNSQSHKCRKLAGDSENFDKSALSRNCAYCGETLEDIVKLKAHLLENHTEFLPKCIKCGMLFALSQELSRHVKNNECDFSRKNSLLSSSNIFACQNCPFSTNVESEFLLHKVLHEKKDKGEKKTVCPLCGSFFTLTALSIHLRTHLKERTFECSECRRAFVRKDRYLNHLRLMHGACKENSNLVEKGKVKEDAKKEERDESKLEKAVESITKDNAQEGKKSEMKALEKRSICGDTNCKYVAKDSKDLESHKLFHVGRNLYQCPECSFSTQTSTKIKRHYMIHNDERSFPCPLCPFKARLKFHLKRHLRLHTGAKPYKCPHCTYACSNLENLRKHILQTMIHPGKKMYECKQCGFSTNVSKDFKMHLYKFHKNDYKSDEACVLVGIYDKEVDYETTNSPIPVKPRAPKTKPQRKVYPGAVKKKAELLAQQFCPIAPKPPCSVIKEPEPSLSLKPTGNLVEDKRKILKMELEKLKNQINAPAKKSVQCNPLPAERSLKTSDGSEDIRGDDDLLMAKRPAAGHTSEVLLLNTMPTTVSVAEGSDQESPQMEFSSVCILSEDALPSEEMELCLLEDYVV